jgi:hypothetical protein
VELELPARKALNETHLNHFMERLGGINKHPKALEAAGLLKRTSEPAVKTEAPGLRGSAAWDPRFAGSDVTHDLPVEYLGLYEAAGRKLALMAELKKDDLPRSVTQLKALPQRFNLETANPAQFQKALARLMLQVEERLKQVGTRP